MAVWDKQLDDYFKFILIFLLFLLLAFDRDLAMIYLLIMFVDYVWKQSDNRLDIPLSKGQASTFQAIIEGLAGLGLFLLVSTILVNYVSAQSISGGVISQAQSIFHLLATSTPILKGNAFLTFIAWGILVPIIETSFFNGRLLEGLATYAENITGKKIPLKLGFNSQFLMLFIVMLVVASLFTLFHITAKGLSSIPLLITFIFSVISSILVVRQRELRGAVLMHILTNSAAVAATLGWL
jgi:hypothetical protein